MSGSQKNEFINRLLGGATFSWLNNNELTLVYLGNGMFAVADQNDPYRNFYCY
jgi:hypothetical protein